MSPLSSVQETMPARDHPFNHSRRPLLERCHPQPQMLPKPERKMYNGFDDFNSIPRIRAADFTVESGYPYGERQCSQDSGASREVADEDDYAWRPLPRTPSPTRPRRLLRTTSSQRRPPVHVFGSAVNSCCQQDCTPVISKYSNGCSSNDTSTSSTGLPFAFQTHQHQRLSDTAVKGGVKERKSKSNRCNKVNNNKDAVPSIKCVVVGDGAVGKTNLIVSYLENRFVAEHIPTASDIYNVDVQVDDAPVRVTICDTPGQDNLDVLRELSYPDTNIFLLCFSVVHPETFRSVKSKWLPRLSQYQDARVVLIGTHADLRSDRSTIIRLQCQGEKPVSLTDAWDFARSIGAKYIESSSRTKDKVKEVFDTAIWDALTAQRPEPKPLWRKMLCLA
ncbi:rho-related GTP-binding protein RhoJ-like [Phlebotomus argentipes]|uniref:rho-related GTP-binding protein RhoJ-like n=1 Tax=Phlebotomus argentipes TaxID=94469 RepID=UPI002892E918|nr:rho-related GTP-binding protein RhoJ-like [Phlebotomus argentipes]XP_059616791.1 rho-related GTP-binding protein RhoJ-like [Phlebotomus argentipes]XP_059616792.1 rho-related GTP-binding protein RhoJ-like [Phlebotomus argentipes]